MIVTRRRVQRGCGHSHDATRLVPNLYGRSHSEIRRRLGSHVIVCLGDVIVLAKPIPPC